ncbi:MULTISPECIES: malonyl-CoA decarboxylase [unclassified Paracoccus (in: a-proteobacteria)]|uniref:malonyl-CoA decarboxylase n=1 Tax=unclassified Paracoccus (in: a-proteobacteria) TaxID=2688777 RepID=UPI001601A7C7|nr:malonyl-CoA decarboxylase [Paracoccus sp. MC1862]MBB1491313.1 malonyl-CoA decarboxylase [Paracoccus sp. MC1854]MBB1498091.1 malonyl-CoA decarboxylase [Paracoccus sp. MC1862]QQO43473.1 malonyl-CoA decarboxylase [Paracoccus sp. MC1862]
MIKTEPARPSRSAFLGELFEQLTERGRRLLGRRDGDRVVEALDLSELAELLLSRRGEASGVALARALLSAFEQADENARLAFLQTLAHRFGPDLDAVQAALAAVQAEPASAEAVEALHIVAEPRRQELLRRLNLAPGGTAALVRMREELLRHLRDHPELRRVDSDFAHLFASWFNRGFLVLRHIDWTTPANILAKIIRYEAVHEIRNWDDLRNRLEPTDRRCYAFFHPQLADEPLIFVEVALTEAIPDNVASLLALDRQPIEAERATTAVFYSISNTQRGLAGVSFGNLLIKQVVEDLKAELPDIRSFVTLSPVPGFAAWLAQQRDDAASDLLTPAQREAFALLNRPGWHGDAQAVESLRAPLLAAAATYFLSARDAKGRMIDPVARFHLGNGARLERLNFLGDLSPNGLRQSHGLMVNYLYDLDRIEANHEAFAERSTVAASGAVQRALPAPSS